ncbi:hypothetical protein MRX96_008256 [Rhipicephalus microplus]
MARRGGESQLRGPWPRPTTATESLSHRFSSSRCVPRPEGFIVAGGVGRCWRWRMQRREGRGGTSNPGHRLQQKDSTDIVPAAPLSQFSCPGRSYASRYPRESCGEEREGRGERVRPVLGRNAPPLCVAAVFSGGRLCQ